MTADRREQKGNLYLSDESKIRTIKKMSSARDAAS